MRVHAQRRGRIGVAETSRYDVDRYTRTELLRRGCVPDVVESNHRESGRTCETLESPRECEWMDWHPVEIGGHHRERGDAVPLGYGVERVTETGQLCDRLGVYGHRATPCASLRRRNDERVRAAHSRLCDRHRPIDEIDVLPT